MMSNFRGHWDEVDLFCNDDVVWNAAEWINERARDEVYNSLL